MGVLVIRSGLNRGNGVISGYGPTVRERRFGAVAHLGHFAGSLIPFFGSFVVTVMVWWLHRDSRFICRHARASLNFQLSMTVYYGFAFGYLYVFAPFCLALLLSSAVFETVQVAVAARRAGIGGYYRYRMCIQFAKDGEENPQ